MGAIDTGLTLLVAALVLVLAWLVVLVMGRRPMRATFKGMGIDVRIAPCEACPHDSDMRAGGANDNDKG